jgi:hypothetical protein
MLTDPEAILKGVDLAISGEGYRCSIPPVIYHGLDLGNFEAV